MLTESARDGILIYINKKYNVNGRKTTNENQGHKSRPKIVP